MACCLIAAFLIGQLVALLRRWGIFWGLVRANPYEDGSNTLLAWVRRRVRSPAARRGIALAVVIEIGLFGAWVYEAHGAHLYRLADIGLSRLHGERVVYIGLCTPGDDDHYVRLVLDPPRTARL